MLPMKNPPTNIAESAGQILWDLLASPEKAPIPVWFKNSLTEEIARTFLSPEHKIVATLIAFMSQPLTPRKPKPPDSLFARAISVAAYFLEPFARPKTPSSSNLFAADLPGFFPMIDRLIGERIIVDFGTENNAPSWGEEGANIRFILRRADHWLLRSELSFIIPAQKIGMDRHEFYRGVSYIFGASPPEACFYHLQRYEAEMTAIDPSDPSLAEKKRRGLQWCNGVKFGVQVLGLESPQQALDRGVIARVDFRNNQMIVHR